MDVNTSGYSVVGHTGVVACMGDTRGRDEEIGKTLHWVRGDIDSTLQVVIDHSTVVIPNKRTHD